MSSVLSHCALRLSTGSCRGGTDISNDYGTVTFRADLAVDEIRALVRSGKADADPLSPSVRHARRARIEARRGGSGSQIRRHVSSGSEAACGDLRCRAAVSETGCIWRASSSLSWVSWIWEFCPWKAPWRSFHVELVDAKREKVGAAARGSSKCAVRRAVAADCRRLLSIRLTQRPS